MRLAPIITLFTGVSLVSAAPIRIVILSTEAASNVAFRPGPSEAFSSPNFLPAGSSVIDPVMHGCGGKGLLVKISDNVRQLAGLPPILGDGVPPNGVAWAKPSQIWYKFSKETDFAPVRIPEDDATVVIAVERRPARKHDHYPSRRNGRLTSWIVGCGLVVLFRILWIVAAMFLTASPSGAQDEAVRSEGQIRLSFDALPAYPIEKSEMSSGEEPREKVEEVEETHVIRTA